MPADPFLSVVIPCLNEENRLGSTLEKVTAFLKTKEYRWQVLIVDDGSTDRTVEVPARYMTAEECVVLKNDGNRGKGYSVRRGVLEAAGEFVLISDADLSTPIREWDRFLPHLEAGCDVVIGSRSLPDSNVVKRQAWYRQGMGRIFNRIIRFLVIDDFVDTQCGFKAFRRSSGGQLFQKMRIDHFCFDVEMLFLAKKAGLNVLELPVEWHNSEDSRVRILQDSSKMLKDAIRIRINDLLGRYR
ncbi:dolichyl-phosphate beta-glucosyltransferase [Nitrospina sp. 32_T5]|uniref:dolichyl-phosphate beta-glucosyltransferase n=1 Tax=unclassified Nitrospina TaxID=2638683 RepID=UPI003F955CCF